MFQTGRRIQTSLRESTNSPTRLSNTTAPASHGAGIVEGLTEVKSTVFACDCPARF
ncbi:hypothetical protein SAMN05443245_3625 [Paraburkholderia fungorum]|uniref:Uncharacterized protein n=1 Tax=Paraburkholderia fungorum TaxID=134537 RepID=A0A1H1H8D1_9BURK|nr:hypothetical protein SAMN05443245_3625 [Paraburkholderia fungorum]